MLELNDADSSKGVEAAKPVLHAEGLPATDENIFIAAACKEKGIRFLKGDAEVGVRKIDKTAASSSAPAATGDGPAEYTVTINGKDHFMAIEQDMVTVEGKVYRVEIKPEDAGTSTKSVAKSGGDVTEVKAQMPGAVYKQLVHAGDRVQTGEPILILEAMKMEMEIASPVDGTVEKISPSANKSQPARSWQPFAASRFGSAAKFDSRPRQSRPRQSRPRQSDVLAKVPGAARTRSLLY